MGGLHDLLQLQPWISSLVASGDFGFEFLFDCCSCAIGIMGWESHIFHPPRDTSSRNRDLFPLPFVAVGDKGASDVCRSVRRRILRKRHIDEKVNLSVAALNSLWFGGGSRYKRETCSDLSSLPAHQREALNHIRDSILKMGPPPDDASCQGALSALRAPVSGYSEPENGVGSVVNMDLSQMSLPDGQVAGVSLPDGLQGEVHSVVHNFEDFMLQDADTFMTLSDEISKVPPYNDPLLASRSGYINFLKHLFQCGVLSHTSTCRGRVGAFCVAKKPKVINNVLQNRQRLVLDCRQTNLSFRDPPMTELGSLAALGQMTLDPEDTLYMASADICDCFYAANLPPGLCSFFCFKSDVTAAEADFISGGVWEVSDGQRICPCISVLPMGFSWSCFLIQCLHDQATMRALQVDRSALVLDGQPPPSLGERDCIAMPYIDNVHSMSTNRARCQDGCDLICEELKSLGFDLHEETPASTQLSTLGGFIDGVKGEVRATSQRMWRVSIAFSYIAHAVVSPKLVQKLMGHAMTICIMNRCGMCIFRKLYDFIEKGETRRLSSSERDEALNFVGIIPLLYSDLRLPWSDTLTCTDASPEGYGICESSCAVQEAKNLGEWCERWRFKRLPVDQWAPRSRALHMDVFSDHRTVLGGSDIVDEVDTYCSNIDFPEVPYTFLKPDRWRTAKLGKWRDCSEHITIKEGRALVLALRRLSRAAHHRGKRHTFFLDNLALVFAVHKGRAHSYDMLRILQQVGSICLAARLCIRVRWVPSEWNPSDGPSRGQISPGPYQKCCHPAFVSKADEPSDSQERGDSSQEDSEISESCKPSDHGKECCEEGHTEEIATFRVARVSSEEESMSFHPGCEKRYHFGRGLSGHKSSNSENDSAGAEEHFQGMQRAIRPIPREVQGLLSGERGPMAPLNRRGRSSHGRLHGCDVHRETGGSRRRKNLSCLRVPVHEAQGFDGEEPQSLARVAENHPSNFPTATASDHHGRNSNGDGGCKPEEHGSDDHDCIPHVSTSRRGIGALQKAHSAPCAHGWKSIRLGEHHHSRSNRSETRQSGCVRQQSAFRCQGAPVDRSAGIVAGQSVEKSQRSAVHIHNGGVQEDFYSTGSQVGGDELAPLSIASRRCDTGPDLSCEGLQRREEQRPLEDRFLREEVRQSGPCATTLEPASGQQSQFLPVEPQEPGESLHRSLSTSNRERLVPIDVFTMQDRPHRFALEIFAGSSRLCNALNDHKVVCFPC